MTTARELLEWAAKAAGIAIIVFLCLLAAVVIGGQTFGQRCTAMGKTGDAHRLCVKELSGRAAASIGQQKEGG